MNRSESRHHSPVPAAGIIRQVASENRCLPMTIQSTYFGILAEFGEANIPLDKVAPKYFGLSAGEAKRRAPSRTLPCRAFRLGGQKSLWLVSASDLAELIDRRRRLAE